MDGGAPQSEGQDESISSGSTRTGAGLQFQGYATDTADGGGVPAQGGLVAGVEVDAADGPVHAGGEGLAAVGAEADV